MKQCLSSLLYQFLKVHADLSRPLLLGLSGGADSLALFYLLLECKKDFLFQFAVAHVDHGWREESKNESEELYQLVKSHDVAFHLKRLEPNSMIGNLEEACRKERLHFFSHLSEKYGYQAVLLGHHANDQAETVLKRILEGASFSYFAGISKVNFIEGIKIWRPFLDVSKSEIEAWLKKRKIKFFQDVTNFNPKYLRARFRTEIIPSLSSSFGKNIVPSLCHIASEALELKEFLYRHLEPYLSQVVEGPFGVMFDFKKNLPKSEYEQKCLIREICRSQGIYLSREFLQLTLNLLLESKANKQIIMGNRRIEIDRGRLFILCSEENKSWDLEIIENSNDDKNLVGWENVWKGYVQILLPKASYRLETDYKGYDKQWTNTKVPAFLRSLIPVIYLNEDPFFEFLSGKMPPYSDRSLKYIFRCKF